jgi:hypothetical protein
MPFYDPFRKLSIVECFPNLVDIVEYLLMEREFGLFDRLGDLEVPMTL